MQLILNTENKKRCFICPDFSITTFTCGYTGSVSVCPVYYGEGDCPHHDFREPVQSKQVCDFKIRYAINLDLLRLIQLGEEYFQEVSRWSSFSYNHEKVMKSAMAAIDNDNHVIFLAYDRENNILGFMWGCTTSQVWSDDKVGHDVFIYVRPQARGMEIGKALIKKFLWWCEIRGCKGVQCGANSGIQDDAPAINMYRSLGFGPGGRCFNLQFKGE